MNWDRVRKELEARFSSSGKIDPTMIIDVIQGDQTELAGRLQQRYGYAKDERRSRSTPD
jgi:hypothetical protein